MLQNWHGLKLAQHKIAYVSSSLATIECHTKYIRVFGFGKKRAAVVETTSTNPAVTVINQQQLVGTSFGTVGVQYLIFSMNDSLFFLRDQLWCQ